MLSGVAAVLECSEVVDGTRLEFDIASNGIASLRPLFPFSTVVGLIVTGACEDRQLSA